MDQDRHEWDSVCSETIIKVEEEIQDDPANFGTIA